jgi:hypothetical protein
MTNIDEFLALPGADSKFLQALFLVSLVAMILFPFQAVEGFDFCD